MKRFTLLLFPLYLLVGPVSAQRYPASRRSLPKPADSTRVERVAAAYADSLAALRSRFAAWRYAAPDTLANPYYFPLFAAQVYQPSAVGAAFGTRPALKGAELLAAVYAARPALVAGFMGSDAKKTPDAAEPEKPLVDTRSLRRNKEERIEIKAPEEEPFEIIVRRPNFWTFKKNLSVQFMQTHISDNWHKGGNSNMSMKASTTLEANYNNKQKVKFDNRLEMRIGFMTEKGDEVHKFKTNDDLIRLTNSFGLQAAKNFYYNLTLQSWTQFYPGYRSNDRFVYSDFMSPFESLLTVGMEYSLSKSRFNISAKVSPLALDFKYVDRKAIVTYHGLREGHHSNWSFGSNVTINTNWDIWKNISWRSRLYYYTNYKKVQAEWENTFDLRINKYLTTRLFLHPRFDDSANRNSDLSFFQFREEFSFGLNVTF